MVLINICIVFIYSPIIHKNNIIEEQGIRKRKIYSRIIIAIYSVVILMMKALGIDYIIVFACTTATTAVTISMLAEKILKGGKEDEN